MITREGYSTLTTQIGEVDVTPSRDALNGYQKESVFFVLIIFLY